MLAPRADAAAAAPTARTLLLAPRAGVARPAAAEDFEWHRIWVNQIDDFHARHGHVEYRICKSRPANLIIEVVKKEPPLAFHIKTNT